jgi:hypothetical protein
VEEDLGALVVVENRSGEQFRRFGVEGAKPTLYLELPCAHTHTHTHIDNRQHTE